MVKCFECPGTLIDVKVCSDCDCVYYTTEQIIGKVVKNQTTASPQLYEIKLEKIGDDYFEVRTYITKKVNNPVEYWNNIAKKEKGVMDND